MLKFVITSEIDIYPRTSGTVKKSINPDSVFSRSYHYRLLRSRSCFHTFCCDLVIVKNVGVVIIKPI